MTEQKSNDIAGLFQKDNGKHRGATVDVKAFEKLVEGAEKGMAALKETSVTLPMAIVNERLGTTARYSHGLAYRLKNLKETKAILAEHNMTVGSRIKDKAGYAAPIEKQMLAFTKVKITKEKD